MSLRPRVLVVDDEPMDLTVTARVLASAFDVRTAQNLTQARTAMSDSPPHILVLDLGLGNERAEDLLEFTRAEYPFVARVVLSGSPRERLERFAESGAADVVLEKSQPETALLRALRACTLRL